LIPLVRDADLLQKTHPKFLGLTARHLLDRPRGLDDVLYHAQVWEQVDLME
jgi:hypothetical protein